MTPQFHVFTQDGVCWCGQRRNFAQIQKARDEVERIEGEYLRSRGWKHTSSNPGCYWLWEKTLVEDKGVRVVLVPREQALSMQQCIDQRVGEVDVAEHPCDDDGQDEDEHQ